MSRILADWLNHELGLAPPVAADELDLRFRSGFLFGEVLRILNIRDQTDTNSFFDATSADALIKNFSSLERTLRNKFAIKLSSNYALDIISGKRGAAAQLLYQIKSAAAETPTTVTELHVKRNNPSGAFTTGDGNTSLATAVAASIKTKGVKHLDNVYSNNNAFVSRGGVTNAARAGSSLASYPSTPIFKRPPPLPIKEEAKHVFHTKEDQFFLRMLKSKLKRQTVEEAANPTQPAKPNTDNRDVSKIPKATTSKQAHAATSTVKGTAAAAELRNLTRASDRHGHRGTINTRNAATQKLPALNERPSTHESDMDGLDQHVVFAVSAHPHQTSQEKRNALIKARRREIVATLGRDIDKFEIRLDPELADHQNQRPESQASSSLGSIGALNEAPEATENIVSFIQKKSSMSPVHHMKLLSRFVPPQDVKQEQSKQYLEKIRTQRVEEEYARKDREQRRRKIILSQQQAQQEIERERFDELVLSKLMRQSKQERRIAEQLIQVRHEKDVMHENRIYREKQYADQRQKDYEEAIAREYELAERARQEYREQMAQQLAQHYEILSAKQAMKHEKHTAYCKGLVGEIIDLMFKAAQYRVLNDGKDVPKTKMREWKVLFVRGESVNKQVIMDIEQEKHALVKTAETKEELQHSSAPLSALTVADNTNAATRSSTARVETAGAASQDNAALKLLDENEFIEYINSTGPWLVPTQEAPKNTALGFIVDDIITLTTPPEIAYETAQLPSVPLRVVIVGKRFAGKGTLAKRLADKYNMTIFRIDELMREAINVSDPVPKRSAGEKPQPETKESKDNKSTKKVLTKPQIGAKIQMAMLEGQSPDDTLLVALVIDAFGQTAIKPGGCILVDFPRTRAQAQMLERELSGYEDPKPVKKGDIKRTKEKEKSASKNRSLIAPIEGQSDASASPSVSGLDCVLMLDVENGVAISRSAGQRVDPITGKMYHLELDPPPKTIPGTYESLAQVEDESKSRSQLHYQLAAFEDEEEQLKDWFGRFRIMKSVDGNQSPEKMAEVSEDILAQIIAIKEQEKKEKDALLKSDDALAGAPVPSQGNDAADATLDIRDDEAKRDDDARGKQGSGRDRGTSADVRAQQHQPSAQQQQQQGQAQGQAPASTQSNVAPAQTTSGTSGQSQRVMSPSEAAVKNKNQAAQLAPNKDSKRQISSAIGSNSAAGDTMMVDPSALTTTTELVQELQTPHHIARVSGSTGRKLPSKELAEVLMDLWTTLENTYTESIKFTFRSFRREQESILRFLHETKTSFTRFLERPDARQEMVELFQTEYNAVEDDLRSDPDAKSELHQRVEDLRDRLWEMSDRKREEAESERIAIIEDRWIEDHSHILANAYIAAMQAELDRFFNTRQIITDYFRDANGLPLLDNNRPQIRIPMVAPTASPPVEIASTLVSAHEAQAAQRREGAQSANINSAPSAAVLPKAKAPGGGTGGIGAASSGAQGAAASSKEKESTKDAAKRGANAAAKAPPPPEPPVKQHTTLSPQFIIPEKEHLVIDYENVHFQDIQAAFDFCITNAIQQDHAAADLGSAADKKDKKKTPDDSSAQMIDFHPTIELEEHVLRYRLERIRTRAIEQLKELRTKGFEMYIQIDEWIGLRFQAEMDAAKDMMNLIKEAIESEARLPNQLVLEGEKFQVDFGTLVLEPEPEPRPESPVEKPQADQFTVLQLLNAARQLRIVAPNGKIMCKHFVDFMQRTAVLSVATDLLPENYCSADLQQFQQICYVLDPFETGFINWRKFMMLNCRVLPVSIASITEMKAEYEKLTGSQRGKLNKSDFLRLKSWFEEVSTSKWEESQTKMFDRPTKLKNALFYVFSEPPVADIQTDAAAPTQAVSGAQGENASPEDGGVPPTIDQQMNSGQAVGTTAPVMVSTEQNPEKETKKPEVIVLGEHDRVADDGSLFDCLSFLACCALDESPMNGLEKAFIVFGSADGLCSAQTVYELFHHFLDLTDISHRFEAGESIEDPYPMETILRVFDEAKVSKEGEISFESFSAACEAIGSPFINSPLFQIEDLTVYGSRSRPSSGLDPNKGTAPPAVNKFPA